MLLAKLPPWANHCTFKLQPVARQTWPLGSLFDEMTSGPDFDRTELLGRGTQSSRASVNKEATLNNIPASPFQLTPFRLSLATFPLAVRHYNYLWQNFDMVRKNGMGKN